MCARCVGEAGADGRRGASGRGDAGRDAGGGEAQAVVTCCSGGSEQMRAVFFCLSGSGLFGQLSNQRYACGCSGACGDEVALPSLVGKAGVPCTSGAGSVGSIPADYHAQYVPSFRSWRFEMKPSLFRAARLEEVAIQRLTSGQMVDTWTNG